MFPNDVIQHFQYDPTNNQKCLATFSKIAFFACLPLQVVHCTLLHSYISSTKPFSTLP